MPVWRTPRNHMIVADQEAHLDFPLSNTEVIEKGCDSLMYTFESRFVFRKISTVSISRSAPKMNNQIVVPRRHGAVRFLFWWLFLHRRLRPRQRGSTSCDMSGVAPVWLIISKGRYSFLSEQLSKMSCDIFKQAFRLRFRTFETVAFRSCRLRTHASPHMFHLPVPVKMPVMRELFPGTPPPHLQSVKEVRTLAFVTARRPRTVHCIRNRSSKPLL
jgi:hypothetical protein